jgi:uncharacterized protein (DUF983 family)
MVARGLIRHCPRCGGGNLFRRYFTMKERCPNCGYKFERQDGFVLGAMTVNIAVAMFLFAVIAVVGVALTAPDIAVAKLTVVAAVVTGLTPVVFYPFSKTVWAAIDLAMRPLDPHEEADAVLARSEFDDTRRQGGSIA